MSNDSVAKTFLVAFSLCVVCSILVSGSAIMLKERQKINKALDIKRNLLLAAGLIKDGASVAEVESAYGNITAKLVDFSTGQFVDGDVEAYDQKKAAKDPKSSLLIPSEQDVGALKKRARLGKVFFVKSSGAVSAIVLPVHGKGLWSTMYGFLSLDLDTKTVKGLGFYQHGETPGLGGEIDNPRWKALWQGKVLLNDDYKPVVEIIKGQVSSSTPGHESKVDGLSGATITSRGVETMLHYWLGEHAYGKFLASYRQGNVAI